MFFKASFSIFLLSTLVLTTAKLYEYGPSQGDQEISVSDDPSATALTVPIIFFKEPEKEMYISPNGAVSFDKPIDTTSLQTLDEQQISAIAPFYVPVSEGTIYLRQTGEDAALLDDLTRRIRTNFPQAESESFQALTAIIVTWKDMKGSDAIGRNTFQLVIANDGINSYAIFLYEKIEWTTADGFPAQAGFYHKDGTREALPNSGTDSIRELSRLSNNDEEASHLYGISGNQLEDPHSSHTSDDDYSYNDYDQEYDPDDEANKHAEPPRTPQSHYKPKGERPSFHSPELEPPKPTEDSLVAQEHTPDSTLTEQPYESERLSVEPSKPEESGLARQPVEQSEANELPEEPQRPRAEESPERIPGDRYPDHRKHPHDMERESERQEADHHEPVRHEAEEIPSVPEVGEPVPSYDEQEHGRYPYPPSRPTEEETSQTSPRRPQEAAFALSCAETSVMEQPCHSSAACIDYSPGHCCVCLAGHYGNGRECLENGVPQRIIGTFEGVLNGEELPKVELHTYISVDEGRAYTAISQITPQVGRSLLLLRPLGDVMAWLFAKVEDTRAYNGFSLTGGILNATSTVHVGDHSAVTIRQEFTGKDSYKYFKAKVYITGTMPVLSADAQVLYPDSETEFEKGGPGFVRSYSKYEVKVTQNGIEEVIPIIVDQQIHFVSCPFQQDEKSKIVVVRSSRPHVSYDLEEKVVRYASANSAATQRMRPESADQSRTEGRMEQSRPPQYEYERKQEHTRIPERPSAEERLEAPEHQGEEHPERGREEHEEDHECESCKKRRDPCAEGQHYCTTPHMKCTPVKPSYRCECLPGYEAQLDASIQLGWKCIDTDECSRGGHACDRNARCINNDGGYECECLPGYEGDGRQCQRIGGVDGSVESGCRDHRDCHRYGECIFGEDGQPGHCKCRGWYVGDGVKHCGPPGEEPQPTESTQPERPTQSAYEEEREREREREMEREREREMELQRMQERGRESEEGLCGRHKCHVNADCLPSPETGAEECVCRSGYFGNGVECAEHVQPQQPPKTSTSKVFACRSHTECGEHSNCVYSVDLGHYRCLCVPPYEGDGARCVLPAGLGLTSGRRPCTDARDCHQNAHCVMKENSVENVCECLPGFNGDGVTDCHIADQCSPADPSSCHANAECVYGQQEGAFVCKCVQGFTGDGKTCTRPNCNQDPLLCVPAAECVFSETANDYVCVCRRGFIGDGFTGCQPKATCYDDPSLCHPNAECIPGRSGEYVCNCRYGYHGDGRTCSADTDEGDEPLLVGRGISIMRRSTVVDIPGKQLIVVPHQIVVDIDYDCKEERLVWSDIAGHVLRSAKIDGTDQREFMSSVLRSPEGVAIDWSSRNVYYADSAKDEIGVASLDGQYQKSLLSEGLHNPRAVALDLDGGHLYYSDWHRRRPVIGKMDLDGSNHEIFLSDDLHLPNGLVVVQNSRELCWVDAGNQKLSCIGLDGSGRRDVRTKLDYPFGLTILNDQRFYWTDWKDNMIHTVSTRGDGYTSFPPTIGGSGKIYGLATIHKQCKEVPSPCAVNNGGCPYLCLPGRSRHQCVCPDNVRDLAGC